jgi:hypothetical protein
VRFDRRCYCRPSGRRQAAASSDEPTGISGQPTGAEALVELTPDGVRRARLDRGISEGALRAAAVMTLSEWRRFMRGDLTLSELAVIPRSLRR